MARAVSANRTKFSTMRFHAQFGDPCATTFVNENANALLEIDRYIYSLIAYMHNVYVIIIMYGENASKNELCKQHL